MYTRMYVYESLSYHVMLKNFMHLNNPKVSTSSCNMGKENYQVLECPGPFQSQLLSLSSCVV